MRGARALLSFLLVLGPVAYAREDVDPSSWYDEIEQQIQALWEQINQLTALWLPEDSNAKPTGLGSNDISTNGYWSTFGTPSPVTYTADIASTGAFFEISASASPSSKSSSSPTSPVLPPRPDVTMGGGEGYRSVAYFTNWGIYGRKFPPQLIPSDKLTHVLYAFADNREDGEVILTDKWSDLDIHYDGDSWNDVGNNVYGSIKQIMLHKQKNRNLKNLLSVGGWTYAHEQKHFDKPASTAEGRKRFADSCVRLIKDLGFDGIDIDWEYPQNPEQGRQLLLLLQEIRGAMEAYADKLVADGQYGSRPHFELSIAAPAGQQYYKNIPLGEIAGVLDFINLMCYDFSGSWDTASGHSSNLFPSASCPSCTPFNIQSVVAHYTAEGVPSNKIVLGMPLYGRSFQNTTGLGKPFTGVGQGSWEAGVWDFKALPQPGATECYDEEAGASYSYDSSTGTLTSYDTVEMARRKAAWIKQHGLGGAMWWELSGDRQDEGSLVSNVVRELGGPNGGRLEHHPNWLHYPDSQYENMRKGFAV